MNLTSRLQPSNSPHIDELAHRLKTAQTGEVRTDLVTRLLYSTDASIYQIEPMGVVLPRQPDDLCAIMEVCASLGVPVLARGAGTSLAGQAIGEALIVDCSRYLDRLIEIDTEAQTATIEPGLIVNALNRAASHYNLQFGPDPASAERATIGGSLANNATGAHSITYGMSADHLLAAEVVLSDGSLATFKEMPLHEAKRVARDENSRCSSIYRAALHIRERYASAIQQNWPRTWRCASGYNLNYLLPWCVSHPPGWSVSGLNRHKVTQVECKTPYPPISPDSINLAPLLTGSEGTLAIFRRAVLRLVRLPRFTILVILAFPGIAEACDATPGLLEKNPSAIELIPQQLIQLARSVPAYGSQLSFLNQLDPHGEGPPALLVVEFSDEDRSQVLQKARALEVDHRPSLIVDSPAMQNQVWEVRKVGLGILMSKPGEVKTYSFIEDLAVPVERLGEFVREMQYILAEHATQGEMYGHASAGCLHIRPMLNLKTLEGIRHLRSIAEQAVDLTLRLGGSVSGEHGDGLARSEWNERMFGKEIMDAFRQLKIAADPQELLNPGKIVTFSRDAPCPAMDQNLRYGTTYQAQGWRTTLDFSSQFGLEGAIEQCNGVGVCRKAEGVMCPSFQATREEMYSTRGRANLLRQLISGGFPSYPVAEKAVFEALDLCLACKGCKTECPSGVDMAKLKYEFIHHYHALDGGKHTRKSRDYLFAYIGSIARLTQPFALVINPILRSSITAWFGDCFLGISKQRRFPVLAHSSFRSQLSRSKPALPSSISLTSEHVIFLSDAFTEYFYPEVGLATVSVLRRAGCQVHILPEVGAGRTLISKGFLNAARKHARKVVEQIYQLDPGGTMKVVGAEPSEIFTLCDEYLDLLPGDERVRLLAERAFCVEEFLIRPEQAQKQPRILRIAEQLDTFAHNKGKKVLFHGHCYQKARPPSHDGFPTGAMATKAVLEAVGYQVQMTDSGCCGMAGAFGYEKEHYDLSKRVGELSLLPIIREEREQTIIAASGVSCRGQIMDGSERSAVHPIELI